MKTSLLLLMLTTTTTVFSINVLANEAPTSVTKAPETAKATATAVPNESTVEGTIKKVVAKKKEIYVMPNDGGKKMEFYFPANAQYILKGTPVGFDALKEGQKVRVTYTKTGKRLNPSKAEILE